MNFLILHSTEDKASMNIRENFLNSEDLFFQEISATLQDHHIIELKENKEGVKKQNHHIYLGLIDDPLISLREIKFSNFEFKPDILIFASRHSSQTARPAFLIHSTGNWTDKAEFGGNPYQLSKTSALMLKAGYVSLTSTYKNSKLRDFAIDLEVTHHGPTSLNIPLIFMELGSSLNEWLIKEAGRFVSNAILSTIFKYIEFKEKLNQQIGLGFGGTHYAPNFSRILSNNDVAISFICPKYFIMNLNLEMINQMVNNTFEKVNYFIVDWKGTSSNDKKHLIPLLENFNLSIMKTKDFKAD